jgi:hypothetical protein
MNSFITNFRAGRMRPRSYAVAAVTIAATFLLATMAANVLIDPQGVFGTKLFVPVVNPNLRYLDLKTYKVDPNRYDAVLFGSSRGENFDLKLLAQDLGVHAVINFSVPQGFMTDHLPALEYLLRDKASRGSHIKTIFLLLDADLFGREPWTDNNADSFLPPEVGGESQWRFWWRYLTIFQFTTWRQYIDRALESAAPAHGRSQHADLKPAMAAMLSPQSPQAAVIKAAAESDAGARSEARPRVRADLAHQLSLFDRFLALCREHEIKLTVAFSPLNRNNEGASDVQMPDNERIVDMISRRVPVWDFDRPGWLSDRPDLWNDVFHFKQSVANMMLQRIFGGYSAAPADFGQLKMNGAAAARPASSQPISHSRT